VHSVTLRLSLSRLALHEVTAESPITPNSTSLVTDSLQLVNSKLRLSAMGHIKRR